MAEKNISYLILHSIKYWTVKCCTSQQATQIQKPQNVLIVNEYVFINQIARIPIEFKMDVIEQYVLST